MSVTEEEQQAPDATGLSRRGLMGLALGAGATGLVVGAGAGLVGVGRRTAVSSSGR
ncbi:hypothetical protein QE454_003286 [Microbacterium sp. SORGH_AS454]|nr:hypothetical protein [Microbacterium sp. SORGH_AS_0454]